MSLEQIQEHVGPWATQLAWKRGMRPDDGHPRVFLPGKRELRDVMSVDIGLAHGFVARIETLDVRAQALRHGEKLLIKAHGEEYQGYVRRVDVRLRPNEIARVTIEVE